MSVSRKEIVDYICAMLGTGNVVLLDEFETDKARHICRGGKDIVIMSREYMDVALPDGNYITAEYYLCRSCGKLLLNKNSLTLVGGSIPRSTYVSPVNSGVFGGMVEGSMQAGYDVGYNSGFNSGYDEAMSQIMSNGYPDNGLPFDPNDPFGFGNGGFGY